MEMDLQCKLAGQQEELNNESKAALRQPKKRQVSERKSRRDENNNTSDELVANHCDEPDSDCGAEWRSLSPNLGRPEGRVRSGEAPGPPVARATKRRSTEGAANGDSGQLGGQSATDEPQLMSIDPTLCHSNLCLTGRPDAGDQTNQEAELAASSESEEQTAHEEFSSSNSSFGPMSISVPAPVSAKLDADPEAARAPAADEEEDEELNSAQSGSVLTVITKLELLESRGAKDDNEMRPVSGNGGGGGGGDGARKMSCEMGTNNKPSSELDEEINESVKNDNELELEEQESEMEPAQADEATNIGVAFESLHFDTQVKSSRHEEVEAELLLASSQQARATAKRSFLSKSASEVKSVCNFISAAISDASRQVDSLVNNNNKGKNADDEGEPNDGAASSADRLKAQAPTLNMASSIERAMFVQEPSSYQTDLSSATLDEGSPRADLSSIFEANVRREIERFESNSAVRTGKATGNGNGNKVLANNGSTERRIAEEIRSFNEREMELKRRYQTNNPATTTTVALTPPNEPNQAAEPSKQHETVVRFGKTFQIPKASGPEGGRAGSTPAQVSSSALGCQQASCQQAGKAIKLSSSVSGAAKGSQATISMHKFIASGGRRFVFTSSSSGSTVANERAQMTKSMSNLASSPAPKATRVVDYKAVDSLNCKETPNVKPGLTRMVIETFSRMSDEAQTRNPHPCPSRATAGKTWNNQGGWARVRETQSPIS